MDLARLPLEESVVKQKAEKDGKENERRGTNEQEHPDASQSQHPHG